MVIFFLLTAFSTKTLTTSYSLQGSLSHQRKNEHDRSVAILIYHKAQNKVTVLNENVEVGTLKKYLQLPEL